MLTSLLPGIRDLRAPLAAGYLWLVTIWLVAAEHIPDEDEAKGLFESVYRLGDLVTAIGLGIALSFVAYVVGMLSVTLFDAIVKTPLRGTTDLTATSLAARGFISKRAKRSLLQGTLSRLSDLREQLNGADPRDLIVRELGISVGHLQKHESDLADSLGYDIFSELPYVASRMIGKEPELFAAQDRLESEAEFRTAIVPPLFGLTVVVAIEASGPWWAVVAALGCLLAILVARSSFVSRRERNDLLIDSWFQGRVETPTWERLFRAAGLELSATAPLARPVTGEAVAAAPNPRRES